MAISKESKQAIRQQIETLHAQKKIAQNSLDKAQKQVDKQSDRLADIVAMIAKLESDIV